MLKTRILTSLALLSGLLTALFLASDPTWALLTLGVVLLGVWEWANLIKLNKTQAYGCVAIAMVLGLTILFASKTFLAFYQNIIIFTLLGFASMFWFLLAPVWLFFKRKASNRILMVMLGILLLLATWVGLVGLRSVSPWFLLGVIVTVNIADSAAYFAGKRYGRHKLAPEISPGKTWEGVGGAMVAVSIYGSLLCYLFSFGLWLMIVLWGMVALSIIGDLFESLLKRQASVKDSSQLLPGHGGVLDRIDGLMPTLVSVNFALYLIPVPSAHL